MAVLSVKQRTKTAIPTPHSTASYIEDYNNHNLKNNAFGISTQHKLIDTSKNVHVDN
jgi:hypothetical protein